MNTNPKADGYFESIKNWQPEVAKLRQIVLSCKLDEDVKWRKPCYTQDGANIVLIHTFKEYCALLFFKGALLKDPEGLLVQQTENVQAARQLRFTSTAEITKLKGVIKDYITEAIEVERSGKKITYKATEEFHVPEELKNKFTEMPELKTAFENLTPGRRRGYLLHFAAPKQPKTREARIEKSLEKIFAGVGWNER